MTEAGGEEEFSPVSAAMAAAVAAADELAKNGGASLYSGSGVVAAAGSESGHLTLAFAPASKANPQIVTFTEQMHQANPSCHEDSSSERGDLDAVTMMNQDSKSSSDHDDEEDAEKRLARSRERNREHARRTRRRKKAQLEALQSRVKGLEAESRVLKQNIEECNIASILVGLSNGTNQPPIQKLLEEARTDENAHNRVALLITGKRKRFIADELQEKSNQPMKLTIDGQITLIGGGKTHINWKSGIYRDENGEHRQLTQQQLESLRRERNRMHAKMTRDRKKCFIATIEKTIEELENENQRMRSILARVANSHMKDVSSPVTIPASPSLDPTDEPSLDPEDMVSLDESCVGSATPPAAKRVRHGFSLVD